MIILAFIFGVVITIFPLCILTYRKNTKNKNNVHLYVARDKSSNILWLYLGKPRRSTYRDYWTGNGQSKGICMEPNFKDVGLVKNDYKDLKWDDEPVEVFLNLKD